MMTSREVLIIRDWFIVACVVLLFWTIRSLNLPRPRAHVENGDNHTASIRIFNLGAAGFRELATWQLCNIDRDSWWRWELYRDSKCAHVYAQSWNPTRLEILAHAPGIVAVFDIRDREAPSQIRIERHLQLAISALNEFQHKFRIAEDFLKDIKDICIEFPWFNATVAEVLPWHDLFREWHRLLGVKLTSENPYLEDPVLLEYQIQFKTIEAHLLRGMDYIDRILEMRVDPTFKDLVRRYEISRCSERS